VENPVDFEVANHFTATSPMSHFRQRIMMRILTPDGRITVHNRDVTIWKGGESQALQLSDRSALRALLAEHFGFDLPEVENLQVPTVPGWE
jgi:N-hydroxyarylamine O-acetyltransferase